MEEDDPWPSYQRLYLNPHEKFLMAYWKNFNHFGLDQIADRVRQIKKGDYGHLRSLIRISGPGRCWPARRWNGAREFFPWSLSPRCIFSLGSSAPMGLPWKSMDPPPLPWG